MPHEIEAGFSERANFGPPGCATFPSWAHCCEVEIDVETGEVALTRYVAVDDVGRVLNPLLCEGQIHGGIVQGASIENRGFGVPAVAIIIDTRLTPTTPQRGRT